MTDLYDLAMRLTMFVKDFDYYDYIDSLEIDQTDDDRIEMNHQMLKSPEVVSSAIEVLQKIITDGDLDEEPEEKQRCQGLIEELKILYAEEKRQHKRQTERSAR
ncbi:MAG: hypothetical protein IJL53_04345 [Firmicutes bacterium]|nr:hypothetical protein [Bacillota bacterium]